MMNNTAGGAPDLHPFHTEDNQSISDQYCFPDNNSSCRKEVRGGSGNMFLFILLSCVSVCTVFLNLLVIISISHFKQLHTPTNLLILSLAVSDLLVGLFVMPLNIMQLIDSCWYLGEVACSVFPLISNVSMSTSLCNLVFIAVDRYIAICDPLLYPSRITVPKTIMFLTLGWSCAVFYNIIIFYFNDHFLPSQISAGCYGECVLVVKYSWVITDMVFTFLSPCFTIIILSLMIFHVARRQARAVRAVRKSFQQNDGAGLFRSSETKAARKLGTVILVYLACWIPYYLSSLTVESLTSSSMVWTVFIWLIYMNSSVNPLLYAIVYPWFRASVKYILTCRILHSSSSGFHLYSEDL